VPGVLKVRTTGLGAGAQRVDGARSVDGGA